MSSSVFRAELTRGGKLPWATSIVTRTTVNRILCILLLGACGAWGQQEKASAGLPQRAHFDGSNIPEVRHQESGAQRSLPDAPSVQPLTQADKFHAFVEKAPSTLNHSMVSVNASVMIDKEEHLVSGMPARLTDFDGAAMLRNESGTALGSGLYRSLLNHDPHYYPLTSDSILSRASYAVSRVLITRNASGKRKLNTSYLFGVMISAAAAAANRPYWARSDSAPFNDFGSTIGSDVGMNFIHELQPGLQQMLNSHSPKFVKRIEERIIKDQPLSEIVAPAGVLGQHDAESIATDEER